MRCGGRDGPSGARAWGGGPASATPCLPAPRWVIPEWGHSTPSRPDGLDREAPHVASPTQGPYRADRRIGLALLFALTLFVGAVLLFVVQPMIAKMVLPLLGGSPSVWNTCMVFFQSALLVGYAYAHATTARLRARQQVVVHAGLLLLPLFFLPLGIHRDRVVSPPAGANPGPWLLMLLLASVGVPFFVVSTTAPLLQRWFAGTGHPAAGDPYFLYGASNVGSMLALLGYPLVVEPNLRLARQGESWAAGYGVFAVLVLACAAASRRSPRAIPEVSGDLTEAARADRPGIGRWMRWVALASIPSSLMLGVTLYVTTDI